MKYMGAPASEAIASRVIVPRRSEMDFERSCQTLLTAGPEDPEPVSYTHLTLPTKA